tara:strand:+ start:536 stop:742 length:207 start_codon:yes stop_codon:yes gene_type:complete
MKCKEDNNNKYPYIGVCSLYGAYAVFYNDKLGVLMSKGSSWLKVGSKVSENGFVCEHQKAPYISNSHE